MIGCVRLPGFLDAAAAEAFAAIARRMVAVAPLVRPTMRGGSPFRLVCTSAGAVGWHADADGYRYVDAHPRTGERWPEIDQDARAVADRALAAAGAPPCSWDSLLVNVYQVGEGSLGWHRDQQEADLSHPIVSLSLGATAIFDIELDEAVRTLRLESGDALVLAGPARRALHRVRAVVAPDLFAPPSPVRPGVRLNFTFRRAR